MKKLLTLAMCMAAFLHMQPVYAGKINKKQDIQIELKAAIDKISKNPSVFRVINGLSIHRLYGPKRKYIGFFKVPLHTPVILTERLVEADGTSEHKLAIVFKSQEGMDDGPYTFVISVSKTSASLFKGNINPSTGDTELRRISVEAKYFYTFTVCQESMDDFMKTQMCFGDKVENLSSNENWTKGLDYTLEGMGLLFAKAVNNYPWHKIGH